MKYCVLIVDGASGWPLADRGGRTSLEVARTPNLDAVAQAASVGLVATVPPGMEPSSACACMSLLGYDPRIHYRGRSAIEAKSLGVPVEDGDVTFRCNLVAVQDGRMSSYSCGHIGGHEAQALVASLNEELGDASVRFYPGVGYRGMCRVRGRGEVLLADCTPPHDIPGKPVDDFLPRGPGSEYLRNIMTRSQEVFRDHPVNRGRVSRGEVPATGVWLFWASASVPEMPLFKAVYGLDAAMTSGVDLMRGLALMLGMEILEIPGVTDGQDNDHASQAVGALEALERKDMVVLHVEAPDEAAHAGSIADKVEAIERVDGEIVARLLSWDKEPLRILVAPDHATPIETQTHAGEPVPFVLYGPGFMANGARRFSEAEARGTGVLIEEGYNIMHRLTE